MILQVGFQKTEQGFHLLLCAHGDPQIPVDPGLIKIPDIDPLSFQGLKDLLGRNSLMGGKDEIRHGIRE